MNSQASRWSARASRWANLTSCAALVVLSGGVAQADDTEVYVGQPTVDAGGRPNILFIIDTSGSMDGKVTTQEPYDPETEYDGDCRSDRIYWKSPARSGLPVDSNCNLRGNDSSATGYVDVSKFVCETALEVMARSGYHTVNRSAQWRTRNPASNNRWEKLHRDRNSQYVECADDAVLDPPHGDGTKSYARNGSNGPFTNESSQQINWNSNDTNGTYTYYTANYLNWHYNSAKTTQTRLEIVQDVVINTLDSISNVNVGLMRFSTDGQGGMVLQEIGDLDTNKSALIAQVGSMSPSGNTPLSETLYEATLYWTGGVWDYGSRSSPQTSIRSSRTDSDASKYLAPISSSCQKNFIVLLTDGQPVSDTDAQSKILNLPGFKSTIGTQCTPNSGSGSTNNNGRCLDDLAEYLYKTDLSGGQPGLQNVVTYTVGFGEDVQGVDWATQLLKDTARRGGGSFYEASDTATLTSVFTSIVQEILAVNTTFTAPTVSVNAFNRTQNLNDLFITVFGTSNKYHWPGNVKKYEVQTDGTIVGRNGQPAVNPSTGFFSNNAESFWSSTVDGSEVGAGGAAANIPTPANRKLYTDIAGNTLTAAGNAVATTNSAITATMLGGLDPDDAALTRDNLIEWVRGADINAADPADRDKPRLTMGDPLHARPVTVIYGGTAENPDMMLYAATNDGYLHAIDPSNGQEKWAYIPGPMLNRMSDLYLNKAQPAKRYGLDGSPRVLKIDINGNGIVDGADKVYLYFGMGRGGQSYYALDITSKNSPRLLWRRGAPSEADANGNALPTAQQLSGLAQTWSTPVATKVKIGNDTKHVLIFGGGYDPTQDNVNHNTDDVGNRVFMLDAITGALLWSSDQVPFPTGVAMQHSIPGDVRVLDLDSNGLADRMYAADTGGRIWRFDIHNGNAAGAGLVSGGLFASLGYADSPGTDPAKSRRFYYAPDVSLIRNGQQVFLNLAIGSGYRGHPLNTQIEDRFYSLRDYTVFSPMTQAQHNSFTPITETNAKLIDVTTDIAPSMPADAVGWKINLQATYGEKVLAEARTFDNKILFTSYLPNQGDIVPGSNSCVARQGINRLYTVNVLDASPVLNREGSIGEDGEPLPPDAPEDRYRDLSQSGIAPEPVILFPETSIPTCIVGVEQCGVSFTNDPVRTFWNRQDTDSGN